MTSEMIFSIILVAAVVVPVWIAVRKSGETRRFLKKELVNMNKIMPPVYDIWSRRAIALMPNKLLTFIDLRHDQKEQVDLQTAESCYVLINGKIQLNGGTVSMQSTDTVELVIISTSRPIRLNMYDSNVDDPVEGGYHVVISKKWRDDIIEVIKKRTMTLTPA